MLLVMPAMGEFLIW